ncbi:MAG: sulfurtransferase TusA family protein [Pseudomonadota bacterium]
MDDGGRQGSGGADWDAELDARGLLCPLPVLKTRKRLAGLPPGARLLVVADDPAALIDVPHFCVEQGHALEAQGERDGDAAAGDAAAAFTFLIRKAGG